MNVDVAHPMFLMHKLSPGRCGVQKSVRGLLSDLVVVRGEGRALWPFPSAFMRLVQKSVRELLSDLVVVRGKGRALWPFPLLS
jgi:hypothetical protein